MADVGSIAGICSAIGTVATAVTGTLVALKVILPMKATGEAAAATAEITHTIVNQERTDAARYRIVLTELLHAHGIEVPADQSLIPAPPPPVTRGAA